MASKLDKDLLDKLTLPKGWKLPTEHDIEVRSAAVNVGIMQAHPFFAALYIGKLDLTFSLGVPYAAADGRNVIFNPFAFVNLPLKEVVFIVLHEVLHCVFFHPQRFHKYQQLGSVLGVPFHAGLLNVAADLVINDLLVHGGLRMLDYGVRDPELGRFDEGVEQVYAKLYKKFPPPKGGQAGQGKRGTGSPTAPDAPGHGVPDDGDSDGVRDALGGGKLGNDIAAPDPGEASKTDDEMETETRGELRRAAAVAKAQGKMPAKLERQIEELVEPTVEWHEKLRMAVSRHFGDDDTNWNIVRKRRLFKTGLVSPTRRSEAPGTVAMAFDTSGSVSKEEFTRFVSEALPILTDIKPERVVVMYCDAVVHGFREFDPLHEDAGELIDYFRSTHGGGGGTCFAPPFKRLEEEMIEPGTFIYFTDMYAGFPGDPGYPTLWVTLTDSVSAPFGETIRMDGGPR